MRAVALSASFVLFLPCLCSVIKTQGDEKAAASVALKIREQGRKPSGACGPNKIYTTRAVNSPLRQHSGNTSLLER